MKKQLNTACRITYPSGEVFEFKNLEEAAKGTEEYFNTHKELAKKYRPILSEAAIKLRCNKSTPPKDNVVCEWLDEHTKRSFKARQSRTKGKGYELQIVKELTNIGFSGLVTSRSQNRLLDNAKVDIAETDEKLSCYIQCKATQNIPSVSNITNSCPLKDRPLSIFWKKQDQSKEEYVIIPKDYFYNLLAKYHEKTNYKGLDT